MNIYRKDLLLALLFALTVALFSNAAQAQDPQVNSANPSSAEQGTFDLDVEIAGSGFDNSAAVEFFVTGTTIPGGITVKKIKVRGSKKIIATIDVAEGATVDDFDIEVSLSRGRKGKGTELFSVQEKPTGKPSDEYTSDNPDVQFISPSDIDGFDYHIIGTPDRELIIAGSGKDYIETFNGSQDEIFARGNDDEILGGDGDHSIYGEEGSDIIYGGPGNDWLSGGPGTDYIYGGDGDDDALLFSLGDPNGTGYGVDFYDGGDGNHDEIGFSNLPDAIAITGVTIDLAAANYTAYIVDPVLGPITVFGTFVNIEGAVGSDGNDTLLGTSGDEPILYGSDGNDIIRGLEGNDHLGGGPGDDDVYGGPGDDSLENKWGIDRAYGGAGNDTIYSMGDGTADVISGGSGCDTFKFDGSFGVDTILDFEDGCEQIDLTDYTRWRLDYRDLNITESGPDILIDFWFNKLGGAGGTIILQNGVTNGVSLDPSDFVF
jgi:Ca2+-binding RTX toxin-like protein